MEEIVDILNPITGSKTGEKISKDEAHQKGIWHGAIHIWIISSDLKNILLQKRCTNKKLFPNFWDISVGGHITSGEDTLTSAKRELSEELGLDSNKYNFEYVKCIQEQFIDHNIISNEFVSIYKIIADVNIADIILQKEEVSEVKWLSKEEFILLQKQNKIINHNEEFKMINEILI